MATKMKDSGIEWVGKNPEYWEVSRLKYLFSTISGNGFNIDLQGEEEGDYPFCKASDISVAQKDLNKAQNYVTKQIAVLNRYNIIPQGSIIFAKIGEAMKKNNRAICRCDCCIDNNCQALIPSSKIDTSFAYYALKCIDMQWFDNAGTIPCISVRKMINSSIALPPLSEQKAIAEYLDEKCGEIDALLEDIKEEIETLEQYKRSVITESVTKGLDPSAPMKNSGIEWVGKIPEHWEVMPNKYLMKKIKVISPIYRGEDILSLTMAGVIVRDLDAGGKMPTSFDGYQKVQKGNLLMCLFDIDVTPRCVGIIKKDGVTSPAYSQFSMLSKAFALYYNYYYLMVDFSKELLHMAKNLRHSLNEEQFGCIKTIVPPFSEQQEIAEYLDKKCAEIDAVISDKQSEIQTLESYKKSLIYEYVTGKKEVG